jgi:hypothetical protein
MLRIRLDAELADLTARVEALAAERGVPMPVVPDTAPEPDGESQRAAAPEPAGERATDATHPGDDATP